jgi:type IV pilus assembly protein PilC
MEFEYVGYTAERRVTKGKITADGERDAGEKLSRDGYQVLSLKAVAASLLTTPMPTFFEKGAKQEEIILFSRQLALLLESGVGIVQSLELLKAQTTNKALAKMLDTIVTDLRAGSPFSASLEKHPKAFNKMYCRIVAVGEQTGQLEGVLRNLASYDEQTTAAARKIKQAMTYPTIVLILAVVVGFLAVTFILPPIMDMFKTLGGELPLITRILIAVVMFMGSYGVYVMLAVAVACFLLYRCSKTPSGMLEGYLGIENTRFGQA